MNTEVTGWRRWIPTDKWVAGAATVAGGVVSSWIATEGFDKDERMLLAGAIPTLIAAYFVSNKDRIVAAVRRPDSPLG